MHARWPAAVVAPVLAASALLAGCAAADIPGFEGSSAVTASKPAGPATAAPAPPAEPATSGPPGAPPTAAAPTVCVGATADGRLVRVDVDAKTQTPIEELPQQVGKLQSFGLRGRQIYFCSADGKTTRFDLDTRAVTSSGVACAAVTADGDDIWVLAPDRDAVVGYTSFDTVLAKTSATRQPIVFPDTGDEDAPAVVVAGLGVADTGILLLSGGTMVGSMDRQTGRILEVPIAGIDGDVASMAQHVTERVAVAAAVDRGLVTFDADGNLARKLLEDTSFTGVACAR